MQQFNRKTESITNRPLVQLLALVISSGLLFLGCSQVTSPGIHIQVAPGYSGVFALVLDPTNGLDVVKQNGAYIYVIPSNGVLRVRTFDPFAQPHKESAAYANGGTIPTETSMNSQLPPTVVACRDTGMHEDQGDNREWVRTIVYVIGTEADKLEAEEKRSWRLLKL